MRSINRLTLLLAIVVGCVVPSTSTAGPGSRMLGTVPHVSSPPRTTAIGVPEPRRRIVYEWRWESQWITIPFALFNVLPTRHLHVDSDRLSFKSGNHQIDIKGGRLSVDGQSYGVYEPNDQISVIDGKLFVNGIERQPDPPTP